MPITIRKAAARDEQAVIALWSRCGLIAPHNPPQDDFRRAIGTAASDILIAQSGDNIVGSAMVGDDGHRGWIYYLAVAPEQQGTGLGRQLCAACEAWAAGRGLRKIQLMIRATNAPVAAFYHAAGYAETPRLVMAKWIDKKAADGTGWAGP